MAAHTSTPATGGVSPGRRTRLQEKEHLQHLNDRFVNYIDRVRKLRDEKTRLNATLEQIQTTTEEESVSVKRIFEKELEDARLLIDETAKEKARYQMLASKCEERVNELEHQLKELQDELNKVQRDCSNARKNADTLDTLYKAAVSDKQAAQQKVNELEEEIDECRQRLRELQDNLERETLAKVDLQNQIQSLQEDLAFKRKVYDQEVVTLRRTGFKSVYTDSGSQPDLDDDFAEQLQSAIDAARDDMERETKQHKADLEATYRKKIEILENQSSRDSSTIARLETELKSTENSLSKAHRDINKLQEQNDQLQNSLMEKEERLFRVTQNHSDELSKVKKDMSQLQASYDEKINDYEELLGLRIQLEQEIKTLSALLQEEEIRLNLQPTPNREKRTRTKDTEGPRLKRKKHVTVTSSSADGFIQICDVDPDGRYVQIKNMSEKMESLGGFKIVHEVEDTNEKVEFRFHGKSKLQGGASVTVWATGVDGAVHNPPTDLIWKNINNWGTGPTTVTKFCTKSGEVVATFTQRKGESVTPTGSTFNMDESAAGVHTFPSIPLTPPTIVHTDSAHDVSPTHQHEQLFHQQGDAPDNGQQQQSCIVS